MTYTDEQIRELSEMRYGTDTHVFAAQRDGFIEGYKEALRQVKNIAYEPVLATVLDDPNTVKLCKPNYLARDGSIKEAERFVDQKNEQIIYYCHKDDMYGG